MVNDHPFSRRFGCRVTDSYTYRGQRLVVLENELLRVAVLPEKGAEITAFHYKPGDVDPLLRLPGDPRPPTPYPATIPSSDGAFMDAYSGGWQEMFPNAGGPCQVAGAQFGRHGEVALLPWRWAITEDRPERVAVRFWVRTVRTPFYLERTMSLDSGRAVLTLDEAVVNEGDEEIAFIWGHHPAFGRPFLDGACTLDVPAERVEVHAGPSDPVQRLTPGSSGPWPVMPGADGQPLDLRPIPGPESHHADMLYLTGLQQGWYALTNHRLGLGFAMAWPVEVFPVLWVWQEFCGSRGYPWYHNAYALGLEPCTSFATTRLAGLAEVIQAGRERHLSPGARLTAGLKATIFATDSAPGVAEVTSGGNVKLLERTE
jgi:hypothetical protein